LRKSKKDKIGKKEKLDGQQRETEERSGGKGDLPEIRGDLIYPMR
jgi:hypothetical protein